MPSPPLILASSSPRRRDLLAELGLRFEVASVPVDEVLPPHLTVRETVLLNARKKADAVAALHPGACVVAADTLVSLEGRALGKPGSLDEARRMLAALGGQTHQVFSGVYIERRAAGVIEQFVETSHVHFRGIDAAEIEDYLRRVDVLDKAGAYAAQEDPVGLIESITGSRTNVIGLPVERLMPILARLGILPG